MTPQETSRARFPEDGLNGLGSALAGASRRFSGKPVIFANNLKPTLHLFHAANSICSQKVRAVLAQTQQSFISHEMHIFAGDTYDPDHVRLRLAGCRAADLPLSTEHQGNTSAKEGGCDACVVPTLVREESLSVIVDSLSICLELDRTNPEKPSELAPSEHFSAILDELDTVDLLPNYQLLGNAGEPRKAAEFARQLATSKIERCDALMEAHTGDEPLERAYSAKRRKEISAANLLFDVSSLEKAEASVHSMLKALDTRLEGRPHTYLFCSEPTLADLFWGVELIRLSDLGVMVRSGALRDVDRYLTILSELPGIRNAVIEWPGAREMA